jgi:translocation and assembly module TamA
MSRRALAATLLAAAWAIGAAAQPAELEPAAPRAQAEPGDEDDTQLARPLKDERSSETDSQLPEQQAPEGGTRRPFDTGSTTLDGKRYRLEILAPRPLRDILAQHLDLARYRNEDEVTAVETSRLRASTPDQVRSLLEPEGYFNPQANVELIAAQQGGTPLIRITVTPGPQARVDALSLELRGPLAQAIEADDAQARRRWERAQQRWPLQRGAAFTQAAWAAAKNQLLQRLRSQVYAAASFVSTSAQVDAQSNTVRIAIVVDSGPAYRLGEIRVEGLTRMPNESALNLAPFGPGTPYSEKALLDYQEALQKTGLYEGVAVQIDNAAQTAAAAPVLVRLRENSLQSATPSVGFSSNTGARVGLDYTHRRPFDQNWIFNTKLKYGSTERTGTMDLVSYPHKLGYRDLVGVKYDYLDAGASITRSERVRAGQTLDTERIERLYYLEFNRTSLSTTTRSTLDRAVSGNYEWTWRNVNNIVFPTRGLIVNLTAGLGLARDGDGEHGPFVRTYGRTTFYLPLGGGWLSQLRAEAGQVFRRETLGIPDTLLFRAGGDDSVRGYGYQTLGPIVDGSTVGGAVLATGTLELMRRISPTLRDWYGAVFFDAGNAANDWAEYRAVYGYGVGVRWRSPIGPLRADIAYGQEVHSLRLHLSVGVSF